MPLEMKFTADTVDELEMLISAYAQRFKKLTLAETMAVKGVKTRIKKSELSPQEKPQEEELSPEPLSPEPSVEVLDQAFQAIAENENGAGNETPENLALFMKMKEEVIDALQAAFRAGKVQKVRAVLADYGDGAKSFREIDMKAFPAISKAIQEGALA